MIPCAFRKIIKIKIIFVVWSSNSHLMFMVNQILKLKYTSSGFFKGYVEGKSAKDVVPGGWCAKKRSALWQCKKPLDFYLLKINVLLSWYMFLNVHHCWLHNINNGHNKNFSNSSKRLTFCILKFIFN